MARTKHRFKSTLKTIRARLWDTLFSPLTLLAVIWFRRVRHFGFERMPIARWITRRFGIYPVKDHFYEPLINRGGLDPDYRSARCLPGINWNVRYQEKFIKQFEFQEELREFPLSRVRGFNYYFQNGSFGAGDAGCLYSIIRYYRPRRIIEIGSGYSTQVMLAAIRRNQRQNPVEACRITCIEPYRYKRLETLDVDLLKIPVEKLQPTVFDVLEENDVLFIDSSHIVRPQGDVLFEILEILPRLKTGVFVHFHDIFSPFDYPNKWLIESMNFWNEQYLLEAFLHGNDSYRIVAALSFLKQHDANLLVDKFPHLDEVGSFWMQKC